MIGTAVNLTVHGIGRPPRRLEPDEERVWVSVSQFERVLDAIVDRPEVRLTFDDGNASDIEIALPRLVERSLTAEFFPVVGKLGEPGMVDEQGVRDLVAAGMRIGSHGWEHRDWRTLRPRQVSLELVEPMLALRSLSGQPVTTAAVPFGSYDRTVLRRLRAAGVRRVYTSDGHRSRPAAWLQARTSLHNDLTAEWISRVLDRRPSLRRQVRSQAARTVKQLR